MQISNGERHNRCCSHLDLEGALEPRGKEATKGGNQGGKDSHHHGVDDDGLQLQRLLLDTNQQQEILYAGKEGVALHQDGSRRKTVLVLQTKSNLMRLCLLTGILGRHACSKEEK